MFTFDATYKILVDSLAGLFGNFELHGPTCFLLSHHGPVHCVSMGCHIFDFEGHNVATAKFAINRNIEEGQVAMPSLDL